MTRLTRRTALGGVGSALAIGACRPAIRTEPAFDADVIILGAGLSGLHAARLLAEEGRDVRVLEANDRVGGRLFTLNHGDGYTEGGGEQVGASYARLLDTADQLDIEMIPETPNRRQTGYWLNGKAFSPEDWKSENPHGFPDGFEGTTPASPLFRLAATQNPLKTANAWQDPAFMGADISAAEFLAQNGFDDESQTVINHALNGNRLSTYSMMNLYRSLQLYVQSRDMGPSLSVAGGAQRLAEAMAKSLPHAPELKTYIKSIKVSKTDIQATDHTGRVWRAAQMICTLPFGALRHISIDAPMAETQKTAIARLPYTQILQIHFRARLPFWEEDGLPADMWTDRSIERVFVNRDASGQATDLCRCWINGEGVKALYQDGAGGLRERFKQTLAKIRPASAGKIDVLDVVNWTSGNRAAGGAYMHWAPGQITQWAAIMGQSAGRLHFAGEHLGIMHTGMEAAMESGERTALKLIDL